MKGTGLALASVVLLGSGVARAFPVTVLQQTGPVTKRFNVAVLGDGYRAQDQAKLTVDATTLIDDIFGQPPYQSYRGLFNVKIVQSVSVDAGAKNGTAGGTPTTLFGANYGCGSGTVSRLLCVNTNAVLSAAAKDVPEFNLAIVVVNDMKYGGSGGEVPVASTNREAAEVLRHELSHNLAQLADEYESPYPGYPACSQVSDCREPNVTLRNVRALVKWLDWIELETAVPSPESGGQSKRVGLYEGARYLASGIYRPVDVNCKMNSLGQPFCPVCAEALVRSFWNLDNVHLVDDVSPVGDFATEACAAGTFSVATPVVAPPTFRYTWTLDGQPAASTTRVLDVGAGQLAVGTHTIVATVHDATGLVRSDPQSLLVESHTWKVTVTACTGDAAVPFGDAGAATGAGGASGDGSGGAGPGGAAGQGGGGAGSGAAGAAPADAGSKTDTGNAVDASNSSGDAGGGCACSSTRPGNVGFMTIVPLGLAVLLACTRKRAGHRGHFRVTNRV